MNKNIIIIGMFCDKTKDVCDLLEKEFESCHMVETPDLVSSVLRENDHTVFVFNLGKSQSSEDAYLKLYRSTGGLVSTPHKTLLFSDVSESSRSYELCREHVFDDYSCITPVLDIDRLKLSVFQLFRQMLVEDEIRESSNLSITYLNNLNESEKNTKRILDSTNNLKEVLVREGDLLSAEITESVEKIGKKLAEHNIQNEFTREDIDEFKTAISDRTNKSQQYIQEKISTSKDVLTNHIEKTKQVYFNEYQRLQAESKNIKSSIKSKNKEKFFNEYEKKHSENPSLKDKYILVIDTDSQFTDFCEKTLTNCCKKIVVTDQSKAALSTMKSSMPDLVVLDNHQPGLNSNVIFRMSSILFEGKVAPVVISTSGASKEDVRKIIESGAVDVINKPIEAAELIEKLNSCIS